jgi:hypothetical protein
MTVTTTVTAGSATRAAALHVSLNYQLLALNNAPSAVLLPKDIERRSKHVALDKLMTTYCGDGIH